MKLILFATDTYRECIDFFHDVLDKLRQKNAYFSAEEYRLIVKTEKAKLVCVAGTSNHLGLYQLNPFDYYTIAVSEYDFYKSCISRLKADAKHIECTDDLIELLVGE